MQQFGQLVYHDPVMLVFSLLFLSSKVDFTD